MCMFIIWCPIELSSFHSLQPWYWNSLIRPHLLYWELSIFSAADAIHNSPILVSLGTHRGSMEWEVSWQFYTVMTSSGNRTPDRSWVQHPIHPVICSHSANELCSGIPDDRVLNLKLCTHRRQPLHLFWRVRKISSQHRSVHTQKT